ncbi:MAG TPA: ECF-type sigma factor [Candidatus Saccharimonadales bacterium]|nr:ECF-type sigma factor [Candidatus Saccharimonadales bacterium]
MNDVTRILSALEQGDPQAADQLLPLVYGELRKLAAARLAGERPGQTLQPTALVHEAFLRLVDTDKVQHWNSRAHFFGAAAEAMRRILIEQARRKGAEKRGGGLKRVDLLHAEAIAAPAEDLMVLDEILERLCARDPAAGQLLKLRYFAGFSVEEAAGILGMSRTSAYRLWTFVRAWVRTELRRSEDASQSA